MKRNLRRILVALLCAVNIAFAVVLWRSQDPSYRLQEMLALGRYSEHDALIASIAKKYGVDPLLVKSVVWRESRFSTTKIGTSGERGLMQVGEAAARDWAAAHKIEVFVYADLFDAKTNLEAGTWYLSRALDHWKDRDDSLPFALAEYNAGRSRVDRWAAGGASAQEMLRVATGSGTRQYVDDVIRRYQRYLGQTR
ncbi:MAG: transglycosylase SLT domain-containing protein [Chthoniobacteraceae bacterium]